MGFGASGSTHTPLGGRPRGRLAAGASLEGPAPFVVSSSLALRSHGIWRTVVGVRLSVRHGAVAPGLGVTSGLNPDELAMLLSVAGPQEAALVEQRREPGLSSQLD
ncbi:hypothetical protein MTO96_050859 [Rhipicephalus appendiculatus]